MNSNLLSTRESRVVNRVVAGRQDREAISHSTVRAQLSTPYCFCLSLTDPKKNVSSHVFLVYFTKTKNTKIQCIFVLLYFTCILHVFYICVFYMFCIFATLVLVVRWFFASQEGYREMSFSQFRSLHFESPDSNPRLFSFSFQKCVRWSDQGWLPAAAAPSDPLLTGGRRVTTRDASGKKRGRNLSAISFLGCWLWLNWLETMCLILEKSFGEHASNLRLWLHRVGL